MSSPQTLGVDVGRDEAERLVLGRLPGARCRSARLLHHPYGGYVFDVGQAVSGTVTQARVHALVDLCSGAAAVSDPWTPRHLDDGSGRVDGPPPVLTSEDAERRARQSVLRRLMHRRSLRHPQIRLRTQIMPLYKPNWLITLQTADDQVLGVLVDGVSGRYHRVSLPNRPTDLVRAGGTP